jgi:hypothetical protein
MASQKQIPIHEYLQRRYAQQRCSYSNGLFHYKGFSYTKEQFEEKYGTSHIEKITSINNKATDKNADPNKID